ncbi:MAG: cell division protein FtsB [Gammaproteobacteria bacterium]|nr:cell division protein FtsB [Gammaproteobacteria bacterium]
MQKPDFSLRALVFGLCLMVGVLQIGLWLSEDGWSEVIRLRNSVAAQSEENEQLRERNARLRAEVTDLKDGFSALEERARADLGMIADGESFYLLVPATDESTAAAAQ